jgi:hypothetical protein
MGIAEIRAIKEAAKLPKEPKRYVIPKISEKKKLKEAELRAIAGDETEKEKWFAAIRKKLIGTCQCGCGGKSQKNDDTFFSSSCCHIFPKAIFKSVQYHPLNYVERAMFGGCHSNMDNQSMEKWVNFADWDDIKEKFHVLAPLLTNEERATKFYAHLEKLIYQ